VLVTRSEEQAGELVQALANAGARAVVLPIIRLVPLPADDVLRAVAADLARFDLVVFTSANAVRHFVRALAETGVRLDALGARVVCVGPATARAAFDAGLAVVAMPGRRFDAEGVLAMLRETMPLVGLRVLLPRAAAAREVLPEGLRAEGAEVTTVAVYRTNPATLDVAALRRQLMAGELDALTFTSPSIVRHFFAALDDDARAATQRCVVAAIGSVTASALREAGRPADVLADVAGARSLVEALVRHMVPGTGGA
jgi:uroporphyrinogen III methyltransferase/synthase